MNGFDNYTPSELIYLFLDGEADAVQQTMLFSALASDVELQREFQDAVLIQRSCERVRKAVPLPQEYTQAVFAAAGFTAPTVSASVSGSSATGIVSVATTAAFSMLLAVIGGLVALASLHLQQEQGAVHATPHGGIAQMRSEHPEQASGKAMLQDNGQQPRNSGNTGSSQKTQHIAVLPFAPQQKQQTYGRKHKEMVPRNTLETPTEAAVYSDGIPERKHSNTVLSHAELRSVALAPQRDSGGRVHGVQSTLAMWPVDAEPTLAVYMRGIEGVQWFPKRGIQGNASEPLANVGVGVLYYLLPYQAVGVEVGRELMPFHRIEGDTSILEPFLLWASGTWQAEMPPVEWLGDVQPFARIGLGGSTAGGVGKLLLGVQYTPEQHVTMSLGVEGTSVLYKHGATLFTAEKASVSYGISVRL